MAVKSKTITYVNKPTEKETLYIDTSKVNSYKSAVMKDYNNIIKDLNNIQKAYNKLYKHADTKGQYKETIKSCLSACKKKVANDTTVKKSLDSKLDATIQAYVLTMLSKLNELSNRVAQLEKESNKN